MIKRTAREIIVKEELLKNKQINVRVGTVENRDFPQTVYINISFWIKPKTNIDNVREVLELKLKNILNGKLINVLKDNYFFPFEKQNIYICNIPENFNYNDKSNFISLEIYLHTLNIKSEKKFSLNAKKNTELFEECVKISNFIINELEITEQSFSITKSSKKGNKNVLNMKKIEYTDENTFEITDQYFEEFHYELAENIKSDIHDKYQIGWKIAKTTDILSNKDGNKLIIGVIKNRKEGEINAEKYKITIEKIANE